MLERIFSHSMLHTGAHLGFFSGMGMLLPTLSRAWELQIKPWIYSPYGFYIAAALILISLLVIAFLAGSASKLFRSVGWLILIPGIIAMVFFSFGETNVYGWVDSRVTGFATAQPVVEFFVDHSVPKTAVLGGVYILAGVGFLWMGKKLQRAAEFI